MPRVNNNANAKDANGSTSNVNVAAAKVRKRAIKKELVDSSGEQNVFHRKSERRRVARDIFLVFEEQPCRRGRGGGANNKRKTAQKPKFGHLMVEDHCRTTKAGLLRDIKNEPKCYLNDECTTNAPIAIAAPPAPPPAPPPTTPTVVAKKDEKKKNTPKAKKNKNNNNSKSYVESKPIVIPPTKLPDPVTTKESSGTSQPNEDDPVCARVNPIFLWVKQEDTHIVEVRCEDYDKRNRIRITKTTNGWRAIPRTDPTSSKIVKIIQTPLLKVKKEIYENNLMQKCNANVLGRQIVVQQQQQEQVEVNEKQNFVTENAIIIENVLSSNNSKNGIIDNSMIMKEADQIDSSSSGVTNGKHKNKKAKTKKEGKKKGRKANKLSIPKVEVIAQQQEPLQETVNQTDLVEALQLQEEQSGISSQKQEEEECRALPFEQLMQSNLETIQNFSKMSISDHHHNQHSIVENNDTASNNNLTEAIELQSDVAEEKQTHETAAATITAGAVATKAIKEGEEQEVDVHSVNEKENKAQTEPDKSETYQDHTSHLQLCPITGLFLPTTNRAHSSDILTERDQESTTSGGTAAGIDDSVGNTFNANFLSKDILVDLANCDDDDDEVAVVTHNLPDSAKLQTINTHFNTIDADTKNLKDLLDEADLMQHCHDHGIATSDADIIDSIVKRSCENNLIQESEENLKEADAMHQQQTQTSTSFNANITQIDDVTQHHKDLMSNVVALPPHSSLMDETVRDSPKCLSFNEAGEIEGLNGELFQTNHFMDTYEKDSSSVEEVCLSDDGGEKMDTSTTEVTALTSPVHHALKENDDDVIIEEVPKDLSYKKREEVCPQSESRSQCAVTSSSDIIKSPQQGDLPAIETTSEAIKNLILEQFMKLNSYNATTLPTSATNPVTVAKPQQQIEPINLGKAQQRDLRTTTPPSTSNDCNSNYATSTNYIETVVIDDNSDDEPMKKRIRSSNNITVNKAIEEPEVVGNQKHHAPQAPVAAAALLIDKDPDPLTQLQLLIRNTQWKVPDPILVPKDRLRAVLASPAREIPLLITTRPELRLPEAFAYPEIIQNPNILVISMAQLEAILKNEMEMEQSKQEHGQQQQCIAAAEPIIHQHELPIENVKKSSSALLTNNTTNISHSKPHIEHTKSIKVKEPPLQSTLNQPAPPPTALPPPSKCSHVDNNLASDINAATLAVLNQMLWLPYFGQLSQEFIKTLNKPIGVQNKYNSNGLLPPPLYNHHMGLQHLDEMYKNYLKQMTALKHLSAEASNVNNTMPNFPMPLGAFQPTMEATVFQKMLQHQLANFLNINPLAAAATAGTGTGIPIQSGGHIVGKSPSLHETAANVEHMHMTAPVEDKKSKTTTSTTSTATTNITADINGGLIGDVAADKLSSSLRHNNNNNVTLSCDNASPAESVNFNKYAYAMQQQQQKQEIDNKPRLTCKSLSNLLEPAESVSSSPIAPLVNLTTDHHHAMRNNTAAHELAHNNANVNSLINPASIHNKEPTNIIATPASLDAMPHFKSGKLSNKLSNIGLNAPHEVLAAKQRKRIMNYAAETSLASSPAIGAAAASLGNQTPSRNMMAGENISVEPNQALWHPLFGSNAKTGYSSPWQWTTVTATGE